MKESRIERYLKERAKQEGGKCFKFVSPGSNGMPDRIVLFPGRRIGFAETKRLGKELRPLQAYQRNVLQALGFICECVDTHEDADGFIERVKKL